jgi:hypothetical protein
MRGPWEYENPPCASVGGDFWFPEKANGRMNTVEMVMAKSICHTCPHKAECAEWGYITKFTVYGAVLHNKIAYQYKES